MIPSRKKKHASDNQIHRLPGLALTFVELPKAEFLEEEAPKD